MEEITISSNIIIWRKGDKTVYVCGDYSGAKAVIPTASSYHIGTKAQLKSKITSEGLIVSEKHQTFLNS